MGNEKSLKTQRKLLKLLVFNIEYPQYHMAKAIDKKYRTVLRTIKKLEEQNLIKIIRREPSMKGGKDKKIYTATLFGLILWMYNNKEEAKANFEEIVEAQKKKLIIFRKWEFFKQKGLGEFVKHGFFEALDRFMFSNLLVLQYNVFVGRKPKIPYIQPGQNLTVATDMDSLGLLLLLHPIKEVKEALKLEKKWNKQLELFKALNEDKELRMFKKKALHFLDKRLGISVCPRCGFRYGVSEKAFVEWKTYLT